MARFYLRSMYKTLPPNEETQRLTNTTFDRLTHFVQASANLKSDKFQALSSRFGMKSLQRTQAEDSKD